jgi:hypothetical protein
MIGRPAEWLHLYIPGLAKPTAVYRATMQIYIKSITEKPKAGVWAGFVIGQVGFRGDWLLACGQRHYIGVLIHKFVFVTS